MLQAYNAIIINNKKIICSKQKIKLGILISKSKSTFPFPGCVFCIRRHCIFSISHLLLLLQHPFFALHILRYFHLLPWPVSLRHANLKFKIEIKRNLKSEWIFFKRVFNIFFFKWTLMWAYCMLFFILTIITITAGFSIYTFCLWKWRHKRCRTTSENKISLPSFWTASQKIKLVSF